MKIIVLAGGFSPERNVSLTSGTMVTRALRGLGHQVALVDLCLSVDQTFAELSKKDISEDLFKVNLDLPNFQDLIEQKGDDKPIGQGVMELCLQGDLTFLALHGACGEDGRLQGMLELLGVTYTGSDYRASALAMDKDLAKKLVQHEVRVAKWEKITWDQADIEEIIAKTTLPVVVKPVDSGSSIGVSIPTTPEELRIALDDCKKIGSHTLLEEYIQGREIQVAVLNGVALPGVEIIVQEGFYDLRNKYQPNLAKEVCPADISAEIAEKLAEQALKVYEILGLSVVARVDFIVQEDGIPCFLEINTLPGMTSTSLLPQEAAAVGMDYPALCQAIVDGSMSKKEKKQW